MEVTIGAPSVDEDDDNIATIVGDWSGKSMPVTIYRTLYKDGYFNTLCVPFGLDADQIAASELAGCELYVFTKAEIETDEESGEKVLRQVVTRARDIEAGMPYLIRNGVKYNAEGQTVK